MSLRAFCLVAFATGVLLSACGENAGRVDNGAGGTDRPANPKGAALAIYGHWSSDKLRRETDDGLKVAMTLTFAPNRMTATNVCTDAFGKTATAALSVAADITASYVDMKEDGEKVERNGSLTCRVSFKDKGRIYYEMPNRDTLHMHDGDGKGALDLLRVRRID